jgi:hypothetical protein
MSLAAALLLAAVAAQAGSANPAPDRGAQVDSAQVSVTILRPAVLKNGRLLSDANAGMPHNQRQARDGRVTYEFE